MGAEVIECRVAIGMYPACKTGSDEGAHILQGIHIPNGVQISVRLRI